MSRKEQVEKSFGEEILSQALQLDPSKNLKYLKWIASSIKDGVGVEDISGTLSLFIRYSESLEKKDIYKWSAKELEDELKLLLSKRKPKAIPKEDSDKVFENDEVCLVRLNSKFGAYKYSKSTTWCISTDGSSYFDNYSKSNIFYILDFKNTKDKFAILVSARNDKYFVSSIYNAEDKIIYNASLSTVGFIDLSRFNLFDSKYFDLIQSHVESNNAPLVFAFAYQKVNYDVKYIKSFIEKNKATISIVKDCNKEIVLELALLGCDGISQSTIYNCLPLENTKEYLVNYNIICSFLNYGNNGNLENLNKILAVAQSFSDAEHKNIIHQIVINNYRGKNLSLIISNKDLLVLPDYNVINLIRALNTDYIYSNIVIFNHELLKTSWKELCLKLGLRKIKSILKNKSLSGTLLSSFKKELVLHYLNNSKKNIPSLRKFEIE